MILLWGLAGDDPLDEVALELRAARVPFVLLDQRRELDVRVELDDALAGGFVDAPAGGFALAEVTGVYVRVYEARLLPEIAAGTPEQLERVSTLENSLWSWIALTDARVLNRPAAMATNNSKPLQAQLIAAHGLRVPETLVTTDAEAARAFWRRHRAVIYKSVSAVRSIVGRLTSAHLERFEDLRWCPTQLQEYIPGRDVRVHVVGDQLFATEVISAADDYRYASRQGAEVELRPFALPDEIAARCLAVSRGLDLPLAGIDLRQSVDDEWYCFEVNPSPCFTYYQRYTHQPIAGAVARYLSYQ